MGVCSEELAGQRGMHWQQHQPERYVGPSPYDPSRDLSPNLPGDNRSMNPGSNNNNLPCAIMSCSIRRPNMDSTHQLNNTCLYRNLSPSHHYDHPKSPQNESPQLKESPKFTQLNPCAFVTKRSSSPEQNCGFDITKFNNNNDEDRQIKNYNFDEFQPKMEPIPPPNTPPTPLSSVDDTDCAGCGRRIVDRYYLLAVERKWHAACLQCCQCRSALDGELTCFTRDGNIYCKKDYYRLFVMKRCARCQAAISSSELVMRARDLVFHVHCFTCTVCNVTLTKGDHYGLRGSAVLCRTHYDLSAADLEPHYSNYPAPFPSPDFHPSPLQPPGSSPPDGILNSKIPFFNGTTTVAPRQKGRPRKRKPKDLEAMTANLDLNDSYLSFERGPGTPGMNSGRSKRMRTSFKHHQLRTMKSYFSINHNPDAKDLKQLSQKTSLPKRVLQVWFQNARAKWRRMISKQDGGKTEKGGSESGGLSDLETFPSSSGTMGPHSPSYLLGEASPTSLECS